MRVAILGVGGLGRTLASELRGDPRVTSLLLIDLFGERARVLTGIRGRVAIEAKQLNVENRIALTKAIAGSDLVINTTLPRYNLGIMQAALEVRANYLDPSAAGPREIGGLAGIFEQLAMGEAFKAAGLTALVSMGLDPGISNVMARTAAERLDTVDAIRIRSGSVAALPGYTSFPLYSREVFLSDVLTPPTVWLDGALQDRAPLSEPEEYPFPPPVGSQRTYLISHEEVKTLPKYLGRPIGRVDFKYVLEPHLVQAILSLDKLGLLADAHLIRIGNQMVSFRRAFLAAFPEPSARAAARRGRVPQRRGRRPERRKASRAPRRRHAHAPRGEPEALDDRGLVPGRRRRRDRDRAHRRQSDARAGRPSRRDLGPGARVQGMGRAESPDGLVRTRARELNGAYVGSPNVR